MFNFYKDIALEQIDLEIEEGLKGGGSNFTWLEGCTIEEALKARNEFAKYLEVQPLLKAWVEAKNKELEVDYIEDLTAQIYDKLMLEE